MDEPGQKLKRARERLGLRYRDVEIASQLIGERRGNSEFAIAISRLADIENRSVVPSIHKLYSICAIYRLDLGEVMSWYGVEPGLLPSDAAVASPSKTHELGFGRDRLRGVLRANAKVPLALDPGLNLQKTTFLSRFIQNWGTLPLMLVAGLDLSNHLYALVGQEDRFLWPILHPGSLVLVDEKRHKVAPGGWATEYDRPIYLLEHRDGWLCAWCSILDGSLMALPHPASGCSPIVFPYPSGVDVIGQVTGVANYLEFDRRRSTRSAGQ